MKKNIFYSLFLLFFGIQPQIFAQTPTMINPMAQPNEWKEDTTLVYKTDTLKRTKEIKRWYYNSFFTTREESAVDTMHLRFFEYEPNAWLSSYSTNLGQFASPAFSLRAVPTENTIPFWLPAVSDLFYDSEDMPVYNTTVPFTMLTYSGGMHKEQQVRVTHTQNVNKDLNIGLYLQYYKVLGENPNYRLQSRGSNIAPWVAYSGNRFSTYFRFNFNNLERQERGGVLEQDTVTPRMSKAQSTIGYNSMLFVQKWNLMPKPIFDSTSLEMPHYPLAVGVRMDYKKSNFWYSDLSVNKSNYTHLFHDTLKILDTALFKIITPMAFVEGELRRGNQSLQVLVGAGNEYQYNYYRDYDLQFPEVHDNHPFATGTLRYVRKEFSFNHEQKYCANGDYSTQNQFQMSLPLWKEYNLNVQAQYNYSYEIPNMFYRRYAANTAEWNNNLAFESRHHAGGELGFDYGNITLRADYYSLDNYVYFDANGTVEQAQNIAQSTILEAKKTTDLPWLSMQNGIIYQQSNISGTKTPTWATYNSVAARFKFYRKLIDCLVGAEALYYPKYYAPQFFPSLGVYAPQTEEKLGDFPIVNAFLTVKYKPVRFMLKYNGVYAQLAERNFLALHYPQQSGILVFSASWLFYN
ncbi:MAG: putative porin [Bacteroidetes bacterium]|nr:putative porin [Bacteroidota bacterium]